MPKVIPIKDAEELVPTKDFPHGYWPFENFNPVQSRLLETYEGDSNIAIAAATSAGKTVCAEMYASYEVRKRGGKALYVGPLKALAKEKEDDWKRKDHHFSDLNVSICTGDFRLTKSRVKELDKADLIVMTPEMLASRCRNHKSEKSHFLKDIGTVIFDESHLLTVPNRGDHIEVALMKLSEINPDVRIVLLSATMPNVDEICQWVSNITNRDTYYLESEYRPCPLNVWYETYYDGDRQYDDIESQKVGTAVGIVEYYPDDKFLIFVHTKRTGSLVLEALKRSKIKAEFHNADLALDKRLKVEKKFKEKGDLRVVIATSTLAWGCYKHGSRVVLPDGSLKDVASINCGDELLCPVGNKFLPRKVIREKDFLSESGYFVKLESGEEMIVSPDHVYMSAKGRNSPDWVEVAELTEGDFIATPSDFGLWSDHVNLDNFWYLIGFAFGDGCICDCQTHADGSQKALLDLCLGQHNDLSKIVCERFYHEFKYDLRVFEDSNGVPHVATKKKEIVDRFLEFLPLGRKTGCDDLPHQIMGCQVRIKSFLNGLFDADGGMESHSNGNTSIGLTNISKKVIESVQTLLVGFGITSSFGKKRMKGSIINGRYQPPVREFSYRIRIFGKENQLKFRDHIGFSCPDKSERLNRNLQEGRFSYCKDLIPARSLIQNHLEKNELKSKHFKSITNCDLWNSVNTQDCRRDTILKLVESTDHKSYLNELVEKPWKWSRIKEIRPCEGGLFKELELEDPHAYVGSGAISHNCNLPARRVIIVGVHRGLSEVENYDIWQMIGRSGRVGLDPRGDAYVLVPESTKKETISRIKKKRKIESTLLEYVGTAEHPHYKTLAFHIVAEIHQGAVRTKEGFHDWYKFSLAHHQDLNFGDAEIDRTIDLLQKNRVIYIDKNNGEYKCAPVGIVASIFYFSPFDVADLRKNFKWVFEGHREGDDFALAMAMGSVDTHKFGIVNRKEKADIDSFRIKVEEKFGPAKFTIGAIKAGAAYFNMIRGRNPGSLGTFQSMLQADLDRKMQVIHAVDSMSEKWGKTDWFNGLNTRIRYGVTNDLVELCGIPNVGAARARRLKKAGVESVSQLLDYSDQDLAKIMKCSKSLATEAKAGARLKSIKDMMP